MSLRRFSSFSESVLTFLGAFFSGARERRAVRAAEPLAIKIDLSRARDRRILAIFAAGSVVFLFLTALGSYQTYQYTESVQFCGKACHLPMEPEFVASQHTGARESRMCRMPRRSRGGRLFQDQGQRCETALSHGAQRFRSADSSSPRRIRVRRRRFASNAIGQSKYVGNVERTYQHFLSDEKNTPFAVRLLLNVGGGDPANGPPGGIHWHMNIANKIEYIATDDQLLYDSVGEDDQSDKA